MRDPLMLCAFPLALLHRRHCDILLADELVVMFAAGSKRIHTSEHPENHFWLTISKLEILPFSP
jgi:hypothetical protein